MPPRTHKVRQWKRCSARALRQPEPGLVHYSDRGCQYCASDDQKRLKARNIELLMSGIGNCCDNSMAETMFRTIRSEMIRRTSFMIRLEAKAAIGQYIDGFYNPQAATFGAGLSITDYHELEMAER